MPERDFETREELLEWADRAYLEHEAGTPCPDKDPMPTDRIEVVVEAGPETASNETTGSHFDLVPVG